MKGAALVYRIINFIIRCLLAAIVFVLFLHSIFSTSFIGRAVREDGSTYSRTLNIPDSPWKHLIVFALVTATGIVVYRLYSKVRAYSVSQPAFQFAGINERFSAHFERNIMIFLTCLFIGLGVLWIALTQMRPGSDPAKIYAIALQWRDGDFSAFEEGEYLFCYPFQSGIILFYYLLSFVFGTESYVGPQLVNVAALAVVYILLTLLARFYWKEDRKVSILVYPALICWVPLFFFITYIYGILPGMACAVGAVYLAARYLETRKYAHMIGAALCIGVATVLKMNCLIYLVAIACFMLYDALESILSNGPDNGKRKQWMASVGFVILMCVSVWGCNRVTEQIVEHLSGYDMPEGEVMVSWVVMGLSEAPKGPGDYNGYIGDVFSGNNYDTELATQQSLVDLRKIIKRMLSDPIDEGLPFFGRKTAYQWNDPTFISMERMRGRKSAIEMLPSVKSLIEGEGSVALSVILNYVQTLILSGILLYLILNWNSRNLYELMTAVVFLGGYLFHTLWEAGASYTIPYFTIMIPYAVKGFCDWVRAINRLIDRRGFKLQPNRRTVVCVVGIIAIVLVALRVGRSNLFHSTIALDDGQEAVMQYYHLSEHG